MDREWTKLESLKQFNLNEPRDLGRALSWVEREGPRAFVLEPNLAMTPAKAFRIGLTGPPGAGKSTLIDALIAEIRQRGLRVAVLAVDPSSPFSSGAILGDRIRYQKHTTDPGVFIRSLGSRGSLGGLSAAAWGMSRILDLAGWDVVLIETVGVGQSELEIMGIADHVTVVLVPEAGDGIQGLKAGLLEIADLYIVNKSDRPGAETYRLELERSLELGGEQAAPILSTTATTGDGVGQWWQMLERIRAGSQWAKERESAPRLLLELTAQLNEVWRRHMKSRIGPGIASPGDMPRMIKDSIAALGLASEAQNEPKRRK
jgi:LAO/AO transport system kinase